MIYNGNYVHKQILQVMHDIAAPVTFKDIRQALPHKPKSILQRQLHKMTKHGYITIAHYDGKQRYYVPRP